MSEQKLREALQDAIENLYDKAIEYWCEESDAKGEMRELGVPDEADACNISVGELRKLKKLAATPIRVDETDTLEQPHADKVVETVAAATMHPAWRSGKDEEPSDEKTPLTDALRNDHGPRSWKALIELCEKLERETPSCGSGCDSSEATDK